MASIDFDVTELNAGLDRWLESVEEKTTQTVEAVANEVLRLSQFEVPHDTGNLQNSGSVSQASPVEFIVGYNTVYAAFQHEGVRADGTHVVTHWQDGRKKKYLEDPIRKNLDVFRAFYDSVFE